MTNTTDQCSSTSPEKAPHADPSLDVIREQTHRQNRSISAIAPPEDVIGPAAAMMKGFHLHAGDAGESTEASEAHLVRPFARPINVSKIDGAADDIHSATGIPHMLGLWHSADMAKVMDVLRDKSAQEINAMDDAYRAKYGEVDPATGEKTGLMDRFKATLSAKDYERVVELVREKNTNDVPVNERIDGSQLIKDGGNLKVGEINHLTTPNGRRFDLYIPVNAQKPLPLVIAMHGVTGGDPPSLMEHESGMDVEAERKGMAVAYIYPEVRERTGLLGIKQEVAAWNMQGKTNLLPTDSKYDDAKYVDNVIDQVKASVTVDQNRIGIMGMSDGGRFAQDYAAARPGVIASIVSESGTWMQGEKAPTHGENVMIVHGLSDHTLPYYQGANGDNSRGVLSWLASSWIPGTSGSRPWQEEQVWRTADGANGPATVTDDGKIITSDTKGPGGEVKTYLIRGAEHAINDYKNQGGMILGEPDRDLHFSELGADWILHHPIHRDLDQ